MRQRFVLFALVALPTALIALALAPGTVFERLPQLCLFRRTLGFTCWGCGMTRGLWHLLRGEWDAAVALHPWAPALLIGLCVAWVAALLGWLIRFGWMSRLELRRGLLTVWLALAAATVPLTFAFRLAPAPAANAISRLAQTHHRTCAFCGLTRSLSHVSRGRLSTAFTASPLGPAVSAVVIGNQLAALAWLVRRRRKGLSVPRGVECKCSA